MTDKKATARVSALRIGVWTLWHDRQLTIEPSGAATIRVCAGCPARALDRRLTIRAVGDALAGVAPTPSSTLEFSGAIRLSAHGESIELHAPVRVTARNGELAIAVTLPVETYVEEVVASESSPEDSPESLKALAIAVRTYALHVRHGHAGYDLCDSTHCQLLHWGGFSARHPAAHAATLATAGETLFYRGRPAPAYFSKDCGGETASPDQIWPGAAPQPYLPARADPWCVRRGGSQWASQITRAEMTTALAARGLAPPGWLRLAVGRRDAAGRVLTLAIDDREIPAEEFRLAIGASLGWNRVPSTWFEFSEQAGVFYFHGRGWGHGVGLCQKGEAVMAAQHHTAEEILAQYFPGAQAADEATGKSWTTLAGEGFQLETLNAEDRRFLAEIARARAEASERAGLEPGAVFTVRAFQSTPAFRDATLAPGWVAAFTEGDFIASQPLATLAARGLLEDTMLHEFLHALVERQCSAAAPLWLREGLVELWSLAPDAAAALRGRKPAMTPEQVDAALAHAGSEGQSAAAHQAAAIYGSRLLERYGRAQVLAWLRSGVPVDVLRSAR